MLSRKRLKRTLSILTFIIPFSLLLILLFTNWRDDLHEYGVGNEHENIKKRTILHHHDGTLSVNSNSYQFRDFNIDFTNNNNNEEEQVTKKNDYGKECFYLQKCFNFDKCKNGFYIYVYPQDENEFISPMYKKILEVIKLSIYFTSDPDLACIFVSSLDTLDRDIISKNFVKKLQSKVESLKYWNGGENHVIFNLFSGTWPDYLETLQLSIGKAIIAKASFSVANIRYNYDISIPLLPANYSTDTMVNIAEERKAYLFPVKKKYFISFKGKRYLYGIGSKTRNSLYLISNNEDIIMLTTCRHGKGWEKIQDDRCKEDNENYDRFDYLDLMKNSTFCLVPRGRRLGSFRFLEVLQFGCIPVLLSNGWDLPFKDVLDWSKFSISLDERYLLQLPTLLREIPDQIILSMKQQALFVWQAYFSSIEVSIQTTLEILRERVMPHIKRPYVIWNKPPGALYIDAGFSSSIPRLPFYGTAINSRPYNSFTAVILAVSPVTRSSHGLFSLIESINLSQYIDQILVVWLPTTDIPNPSKWPKTKVSLRVVNPSNKTMNARYINMDLIKTDAIFSLDEDVNINSAEIDFAFSVWRSNPDRLIGFETSSHYLEASSERGGEQLWRFTSKHMNEYSMIRTSSAIYHRYYNHHYSLRTPKVVHSLVNREKTCESLAMNFLVSYLNGKAPIKVARSSEFVGASLTKERISVSFTQTQHFDIEQKCFDELVQIYRGVPLVRSKVAMNPVLFRDPVSIIRKKYKRLG